MALKFYKYGQNNSGGYYWEDDDFRAIVIIEAASEDEADDKMRELGGFSLPYCECCGPRFGYGYEYAESIEELTHNLQFGADAGESFVIHRADGTRVRSKERRGRRYRR